MSAAPNCPYCGQKSELTDSSVIYGRSYGPIYLCRPCDAYVGCHHGTTTPLGRLANRELREMKKAAHAAFDPIWERELAIALMDTKRKHGLKGRIRGGAYARLAEAMNIPKDECHIGMFDVDRCKLAIEICQQWRQQLHEKVNP